MRTNVLYAAIAGLLLMQPVQGGAEPRKSQAELIYKSRIDELRQPTGDDKPKAGKRKPRAPRRYPT